MGSRFQAVVFDWYATLASPSATDWWQTMFEILDRAGARPSDEALTRWTSPPLAHPEASLDERAYREYEQQLILDLLVSSGLEPDERSALGTRIIALRDEERVGIYSDVAEMLDELRRSGVIVALCSNWSWDLDRHLEHNAITEHFDVVVCSAIVGYRKPHPAIFEALLGELELPAEQVAFVGDDWNADIEGAREAGLFPIHLARAGCGIESHGSIPCASDLAELRQLIN